MTINGGFQLTPSPIDHILQERDSNRTMMQIMVNQPECDKLTGAIADYFIHVAA